MTDTVKFKISNDDRKLVSLIARRAFRDLSVKPLDVQMDLTACHANGCPLDFAKLLKFDDFNFTHDISGIGQSLNRDSGALENFFLPRCAA